MIAVDIGNHRAKFGRFDALPPLGLPEPVGMWQLPVDETSLDALPEYLVDQASAEPSGWFIGSVNRPAMTQLVDWLRRNRPADAITLLAASDVTLPVALPRPDMVGVDRLLDAVAADCLRQPDRAAVIVDVGSAVTVDVVSPAGEFLGGAILPGLGMSARALHEFTDLLPLIRAEELADPPAPLGTTTEEAMQSGLFWGAVGGIRELATRLTADYPTRHELYLTGGAANSVAHLLGPNATYLPHLTLAGIALTAAKLESKL